MIKNLVLKIASENLLKDYYLHLSILGYGNVKSIGSGVREFLWRMEREQKELRQITPEDIQNHYEYLQVRPNHRGYGTLSGSTIKGYLFSIRLFFDYVYKENIIGTNPMSSLSFPGVVVKQREVLTKGEIKNLYEVCESHQQGTLLGMFYGCGLRKSEGEKVNLRDVDLVGKLLYVRNGKGRKRRVIPIAKEVVEDFKNYKYQERFHQNKKDINQKAFMLNTHGRRMRGGTCWLVFKKLLKRSEIKKEISLYHLRHTIATHLLQSGMGIEKVRDFLGHEQIETTQVYTRVSQEQLNL